MVPGRGECTSEVGDTGGVTTATRKHILGFSGWCLMKAMRADSMDPSSQMEKQKAGGAKGLAEDQTAGRQ